MIVKVPKYNCHPLVTLIKYICIVLQWILIATLQCICKDTLTDVLRAVSVLWNWAQLFDASGAFRALAFLHGYLTHACVRGLSNFNTMNMFGVDTRASAIRGGVLLTSAP